MPRDTGGRRFRGIAGCLNCRKSFEKQYGPQKYCSKKCQFNFASKKYIRKSETLEGHIIRISRRVTRNGKKRNKLSVVFLLELYHSQRGLCALSGIEMTWYRFKGRTRTNISIDRINPQRGYTRNNVQLVCDYINMAKRDLTTTEFKRWCSLVSGGRDAVSIA